MPTPGARAEAVRKALPQEGLFAEKEWRISPEPFPLDAALRIELEKLGYRLLLFTRACNELYHLSVSGKQPPWIADYLDRGKPPDLVEYSRRKDARQEIPRIIRPDVILTAEGYAIAELDSVPGGIGLTAWLNRTYAEFGDDVVGGANGMLDGFDAILGGRGDIVVSKEAATYRPEMQWLANQLNARHGGERYRIVDGNAPQSAIRSRAERDGASNCSPGERLNPQSVYRFFELFDLENVPLSRHLMNGSIPVTPPFKPYMEEKMWFAFFWLRPLRDYWRRALGERQFLNLQKVIPYTWLMDPTPLPQHAVIPELEIHDWRELAGFSQKERELILKISGFSELSWGSRGVVLGQDMPHQEWEDAIGRALAKFESHPHILQRFHKGRLVRQPWFDFGSGETRELEGRVRLCPYYFIVNNRAELRGALATICPADKKLLHGMSEAILAPAGS